MTLLIVQMVMASILGGMLGRGDLFAPPQPILAAETPPALRPAEAPAPPAKRDRDSLGVKLTAPTAALVDTRTGTLLYSEGHERIVPIASITKLMTALVLLDGSFDTDAPVMIEAGDNALEGIPYLKTGDTLAAGQMFDVMLVGSANNAAMALARTHGGREAFVARMNAKARELGLQHTTFADPTGYLPQNASTPLDVARLAWMSFGRAEIREALLRREIEVRTQRGDLRRVPATNVLLGGILDAEGSEILGGKTGYTEEAGYTLVVRAKRGNADVIGVVLGSRTSEDRFQDAKSLLEWSFRTFDWSR